jgi:SAM-dependent methyltransferase
MNRTNPSRSLRPGRYDHPNLAVRREIARQLRGRGIEFGPGCHPIPLGPFVESVSYCDALDRNGYLNRYPESAHEIAGFPEHIDYLLDFDKEWFVERMGKGTMDFVIASHILEHLVNPLRFLEQCYEILGDGGMLYIGVPDMRKTFDADRQRTPLSDVVARYRANETELSEARIGAFVSDVVRPGQPIDPTSPYDRQTISELRARTIHVNVWLLDDIIEILLFLGRELVMPLELLDGICYDEEFILLFRKTDGCDCLARYPVTVARLCSDSYRYLLETRYLQRLIQLDALEQRVREVQNFVRLAKRLLRAIPGVPLLERALKRDGAPAP